MLDVLAFGAHPDDVEMTSGGLLCRLVDAGLAVGIIDLTRGELGTRGTPEVRTKEAQAAARIMGARVRECLDMPDGAVRNTAEARIEVIRALRKYRPRLIIIPYWECEHPDHANTGRLVKESAYLAGLKKIDTGQERFRPARVIHYMTHHRFEPSFIVPIDEYFERKMEAVRAHASQFYRPDAPDEDETRISQPGFLDLLALRDRTYGAMVGAMYGEPYFMRGILRIENPFALWCRT
ncbi:MAG: bacillithiol biosynthesis deacetylase BshB1 [Candidatus Abyssobacteria bacterium SURF_17]|uniref:Bacillithiol biosynthesis deacetylase BshB1 n=1 Tax=Candidatus Abyssobacteria bacterium SURF_17 TaxID=2093361 RepID=A0A419ETG0_9BACT|nr:MAG: bacillithiol biosynthesis deacetylase BshB1 [Candidatus Abyssubacteria bacterium SURF_17]